MIVIFEGLDGSGKTTLINRLLSEAETFNYYGKEKTTDYGNEYRNVVKGEYLAFAKLAKYIDQDLFIDRFHLSEYVYSRALNETHDIEYLYDVDKALTEAGVKLVICEADVETILSRRKDDSRYNSIKKIERYCKLYSDFICVTKLEKYFIDTDLSIEGCLHDLRRIVLKREDWDTYFMNIAFEVQRRSTCARRKVGAVLVKDNSIISTGYNGSVRGADNCMYLDNCIRSKLNIKSGEQTDITMASHAEMNVVAQAAKNGINIEGTIIYITNFPCSICLKLLKQAGVEMIVYKNDYNDNFSHSLAESINMKIHRLNNL